MTTALIILGIFVIGVMIVGNVVENRAHKSPKAPMEDLRTAYAPDLIQVFRDQDNYQEKQKLEGYMEQARYKKERWEQYNRELQNAKIKRWLEGNPVTRQNPLTEEEQPIPPYNPYQGSAYYYGYK